MRSMLGAKAIERTIPAPTGGLNGRDPVSDMEPTDAVILENLIPGTGGVSLRGGYINRSTGIGGPVNALMRYNPPGLVPRLFAASGTSIFDVTLSGPVGAAVVTGLSSDKWQSVNFGTPGGNFLVAANGTDAPRVFNGSVWSAMTFTTIAAYPYTLTPANLKSPAVFGSRLWFIEKNSLRVWFQPINQIASNPAGGSTDPSVYVNALDFASQCKLGGSLVAMAVWTRDGGTGSDDYAVFLTSAGEVLIYAGTDPLNVGTWARVGVFRIPPPIGERCILAAGADVAILTQTGVVPLSSVLPLTLSQDDQVAITDKIRGTFKAAFQRAPSTFGWQMAEYPAGALLIVNAPQVDGTFQQFVMNVLTKAWCVFVGLPSLTWALFGDLPVFGTADGRVCQYDVGNSDLGQPVSGTVLPAFSSFKVAGKKRFTLARPLYTSAQGYRAPIKLKLEYDTSRETLAQPNITPGRTPWGSPWGSPWGPKIAPNARWEGIRGDGEVASILVSASSFNPFRLDRIDVSFEPGGLF